MGTAEVDTSTKAAQEAPQPPKSKLTLHFFSPDSGSLIFIPFSGDTATSHLEGGFFPPVPLIMYMKVNPLAPFLF